MKSWKDLLAIVVILLILWMILRPVPNPERGSATQAICMSNIKQLAEATLLYSADHDNLMPDRDQWMDLGQPYYQKQHFHRSAARYDTVLHCPVFEDEPEHYGYALNSLIKNTTNVDEPATTIMIYDSMNLARNASDPLLSILPEGRHPYRKSVVVALLDGHASVKQPGWVQQNRR